jgi:hypothetical protein
VSDLSSKTFCVVDFQGLFVGIAVRLAQCGARVFYQTPEDKRRLLNDAIVGDGIESVIKIDDCLLIKDLVDCFVFPDVAFEGLQKELRSQGFPVWGAGAGVNLELDRVFFMEKLAELGLDVAPYKVVTGLTALGEYLKDKEDIFIKVSKWRGTWETTRWNNWEQDWKNLDYWAVKFGGVKEEVPFVCFDKIDTDLEIGADTYCVRGQWPSKMLHGIESKDEAYFSAVTDGDKMPEQLMPIMHAFSPSLKKMDYVCQWSMEVRVKDDKAYFIDATCRGGLPSTATFLQVKNVPEIIYYGALGEMVEPDFGFLFSCEAMVKISGKHATWETMQLTPDVKSHLMLADYCEVDGKVWFPADEDGEITDIGWLCATGDTPTEAAKNLNSLADQLPDGADASVESLAQVIREIESEHDEGIKFTEQPLPDPEIVLEKSAD